MREGRAQSNLNNKGILTMAVEPTVRIPLLLKPISLFHRIWLVAGLSIAVTATVAWSSFLGYALFRLAF